jgi:membrane protein DedA with SNARE-associated domain
MPQWITSLFAQYGYAVVVVGVFLENVGIPVPGETVLLAAGFFAKQQVLRLSIVIPCAIVAAILGDNLGYWIGRRGGRTFVERRGKYFGFSAKRLASAEAYFREHGPRTIVFARFIPGIRVVAALAAGVTHVRWPIFLVYNTAGAVVWATAIAFLGYLFGHSWTLLERSVSGAGLVLLVLVVAAIAFAVLRRRSSCSPLKRNRRDA